MRSNFFLKILKLFNKNKRIKFLIVNNFATEKETVKTLDTLFKKTNTKPNIYYLPLSEEEVKLKFVFLFFSFRFSKKSED